MTRITTNNHSRPFVYRSEVPDKVLADQFDHLDTEESQDGFFRYHGHWYHISDSVFVPAQDPDFAGWHGMAPDSAFSGVLIRVSPDGESYTIGTYIA